MARCSRRCCPTPRPARRSSSKWATASASPGLPRRGCTCMNRERLTRWLVAGPPFVFMVAFFVLPALIMVAASFRYPGEHGGLAPLVEHGHWQLTLETYRFFF